MVWVVLAAVPREAYRTIPAPLAGVHVGKVPVVLLLHKLVVPTAVQPEGKNVALSKLSLFISCALASEKTKTVVKINKIGINLYCMFNWINYRNIKKKFQLCGEKRKMENKPLKTHKPSVYGFLIQIFKNMEITDVISIGGGYNLKRNPIRFAINANRWKHRDYWRDL